MTCRHTPGDPNCTSGNSAEALARKGRELVRDWGGGSDGRTPVGTPLPYLAPYPAPYPPSSPPTPDAENYTVIDAVECGEHLVLKVQYPSCAACSFEGTKIMVYLDCTAIRALKWIRIDPHFAEMAPSPECAPPPCARFPASAEGWDNALAYAKSKAPTAHF